MTQKVGRAPRQKSIGRRAQRAYLRAVNGTPRVVFAPPQKAYMRVIIKAQSDILAGEELLLLAALEELKRAYDRIDLEYITPNVEMYEILKGNWFLKKFYHVLEAGDIRFQEIVGDDYGFVAFEPDPQVAVIAEENRYKIVHEQEVRIKTEIWQSYQARGMKDIVLEEVPYNFRPQWHKSNGYLYSITDRLGLQVEIPFTPIPPYGEVSKDVRKKYQSVIHKSHITDSPFCICDFREEVDEIGLFGVVGKMLDPIRIVSAQVVEKEISSGIGALLCLLQAENCKFVITPVGDLLYAAGAVQVPNVLCVYKGGNHMWDGCSGSGITYPLLRDTLDDTQVIPALAQALKYMLAKGER